MINQTLKNRIVNFLLPQVQTPGQYIGGEWNSVVKDHGAVRGKLCLAFPDTYAIGMSHHGLQVLYALMNRRDWACERAFMPLGDFEGLLREEGLPLFSLETYTPLRDFDVVGFTLQYDLGYTNLLTMLDLGQIPIRSMERTEEHPLVIAGGPCAVNPEPMAPFIDVFLIGDGEIALPQVCDLWMALRGEGKGREEALAEIARRLPFAYVPRFYEPTTEASGRVSGVRRLLEGLPEVIEPVVVDDLDAIPLPTAPVVPHIEMVQDRIAIEIMRGCPGRCRFCQSTTIKRPLRFRKVETIVEAAMESYRTTGYNEISLLSLSTSDYPEFETLMRRMQETFRPLGVSVSLPSLRINEQLASVSDLLNTDRHSGLTLAPEVARDEMRVQIGKPITNAHLYEGCRTAFANGFQRVKLYFMVGLPGETVADWDGIVEMAETIAKIGRDVRGRFPAVVANVSNFVPKPQTPYQWNAMARRDYFHEAHQYLRRQFRLRCVTLKYHDVETSLIEGMLSRGDRRVAEAIESVWRKGARMDAWSEHFRPDRWWESFAEAGITDEEILHTPVAVEEGLPWDHLGIRQGRGYLKREQIDSATHLKHGHFIQKEKNNGE